MPLIDLHRRCREWNLLRDKAVEILESSYKRERDEMLATIAALRGRISDLEDQLADQQARIDQQREDSATRERNLVDRLIALSNPAAARVVNLTGGRVGVDSSTTIAEMVEQQRKGIEERRLKAEADVATRQNTYRRVPVDRDRILTPDAAGFMKPRERRQRRAVPTAEELKKAVETATNVLEQAEGEPPKPHDVGDVYPQ